MGWNQVESDWKHFKGKVKDLEGIIDDEFEYGRPTRPSPRHATKKMRDRKRGNKKEIGDWEES